MRDAPLTHPPEPDDHTPHEEAQIDVSLRNVTKRFGETVAVDSVDLDVYDGEFFSLLGPSGCGKTTTLSLLAGFEAPDSGTIHLRSEDVTHVPAFKRDVNTVFQNYELFPHLTVSENVAYGPRMKKTNKHEATTRVEEMLQIVQLGELSERYPRELSGGEQQRVALARALVNRPAALLLDEPLSALDVKLRKQMQHELKQLQMALGTTFIYVTHDQEEAMVMSDRIAVMNHGKILQTGTPLDIYEAPTTGFVADFIGSLNVITVTATRANDGRVIAAMSEGMVELEPATPIGEEVMVAIRPERISLASPSTDPEPEVSYLPGEVSLVDFRGTTWYVELMTDAGTISALVVNDGGSRGWAPGDRMLACWQRDAVFTLPVVD